MHLEGYDLNARSDLLTFSFLNTGSSGTFQTLIIYTPLPEYINTYNLGFGVLIESEVDGEVVQDLDDEFVTDNGNRDEVLATVAQSLLLFWERYPFASVFIAGSNPARTRMYRGMINIYGYQLQERALFFGVKNKVKTPFVSHGNYDGFILEPYY